MESISEHIAETNFRGRSFNTDFKDIKFLQLVKNECSLLKTCAKTNSCKSVKHRDFLASFQLYL